MFKNFREEKTRADERELLIAKINDKYKFSISKNKITNTDFLNLSEKALAEKYLRENHIENYIFFGENGDESDRYILIFFPQKFSNEIVKKNYEKIVSAIRIELPENENYEHRIYLSGIMKLGIKREKIGDILVREKGADIIILNEVSKFLLTNLPELTRFKKAKISLININDIEFQEKDFEEFRIIVSSMRLDCFVAELAKTSRGKVLEIIESQRVFVNYNLETKFSKKINLGDIITIRGKGKFIVQEIVSKTKSDKYNVNIKKYV